jgi:hypothetical protein
LCSSEPAGLAPFCAVRPSEEKPDWAANLILIAVVAALQGLFVAVAARRALAYGLHLLLSDWGSLAFRIFPGFGRTWLAAFVAGVLALALAAALLCLLARTRDPAPFIPALRVEAVVLLAFSFAGMLAVLILPPLAPAALFAWLCAYCLGLYEAAFSAGVRGPWQGWVLAAGGGTAAAVSLWVFARLCLAGVVG